MPTQPTIGLPDEFLKEGAIPQSPLALQPPKAVVPEDKPLTSVSSDNLVQDIGKSVGQFQEEQTRMEELQGQITSVKDKIIETEKLKAEALKKEEADRKAGELSQEEKTAFGVVDNKEDPVLTELQQQQTQINTDFTNVQNELEVLKTGMSVAQSNLIGSIQDTFDVRRKAMEDVNQREQAMYQTFNIRSGGARYSPLSAMGVVSTAEKQSLMRLAELDALEKSTIVQAQLAYSKQEFEIVFNEMENLNDQRESTNKQIRELQGITRKRNEEIQKELNTMRKQSTVVDLIRNGITNPADIFNYANYDESGNLIGDITLEDIDSATDIILEEEAKNSILGKPITYFTDEEGYRVATFYKEDTGEVISLRIGKTGAETGGERKLTPSQEATLSLKLAKNFENYTSETRSATRSIDVIRTGYEAALNAGLDGTSLNAPSQAVLVKFQKMLDPTSVVRESEYARSGAGLSLMGRIEGLWTKIQVGGAGLTEKDLGEFYNISLKLLENYQTEMKDYAGLTKRQADSWGLDMSNILTPGTLETIKQEPGTLSETDVRIRVLEQGYDYDKIIATGNYTMEQIIEKFGLK